MTAHLYKLGLLCGLLVFCLGAAIVPDIPLALQQGQAPPIKFGQTYQELAKTWHLDPWVEDDNPPFFLLAHSVLARGDIVLFGQPFLCRFYFDNPDNQGRLLAIDLVHWEKGHSRPVQKAEAQFNQAMLKAYGQIKPEAIQNDNCKIISYNWPGVKFSNQHDEGGQTWYITFTASAHHAPLLEGLPLAKMRDELSRSMSLEPYFEPGSRLPAIAGREYNLNLPCSPLALRTYYLFSDYNENSPLIGIRMILSQPSMANWPDCRLEQLKQGLELKYGKPKSIKNNHFVWQDKQGRLSLRQVNTQAWILEFMAAADNPPAIGVNTNFPPEKNDIPGWDKLKWNMSPGRALGLYPHMEQTAYARAGGQGSFFAGTVNYNEISHNLRLSFSNLGLEEISLSCADQGQASVRQQEALKQRLENQYGPSDWQHNNQDETTYYWSRASGYLQFTIFKDSSPHWLIIFKQRQPMVQ